MSTLLIKNGKIVDPATGLEGKRDILLAGGKIQSIGARISQRASQVVDAQDCYVFPGFIDMHTHLRDPGRPDKETIFSGTRAAARGGFTTVCCMANTEPVIDNPAVLQYILGKAKTEAVVNVLPIAAVTQGLKGETLTEMGLLLQAGAIAFSDDGRPIARADVMRHALEYARQFKALIIAHCEDKNLAQAGVMHEGLVSTANGLPGIPALAEEIMVARDLMLAREYGKVHIAHVSSAASIELIRRAKRDKVPVTCETCPHYFSLTEEAVKDYDTNAKVNPPLKTMRDVKAIIKGLQDGTIDTIATDHAPHNIEEKQVEFNQAAFGMVGLETAFSLVWTKLVGEKLLSVKDAVAKVTAAPARILNLKKGTLQIGADADIVIFDPKQTWIVNPQEFASKSRNTPFAGWKMQGKIIYTIVGGRPVLKNSQLVL